jgi:hypothetical protein
LLIGLADLGAVAQIGDAVLVVDGEWNLGIIPHF